MSPSNTNQSAVYQLSKESLAYIGSLAATGASRDIEVTIALAMAASTLAQVPTGVINQPEGYFLQQAGVPCMQFIAQLNELVAVDYNTALELSRCIFIQRYEAAAMPFTSFDVLHNEGMSSIFGFSKHFPSDVVKAMDEKAKVIIRHYKCIKVILDSLKGE